MARTEYEQLEYQRKNPHLFTTLSQAVNADGTVTTYEQITRELKKTVDKLQELHSKSFGGVHPVYCMRPIIGGSENPICQSIKLCERDMERCQLSFVNNYKYMADRLAPKEEPTND